MTAVAVSLSLLMASVDVAAGDFSSLEERMSAAEFRAAGLDKLSPEELARLNDWLRAKGPLPASAAAASAAGFRSNTFFGTGETAGPIASEVAGEFSGWNEGDQFTLANGQVWEVTQGSFAIPEQVGVRVSIEPAFMGSWLMKIEGYNASARVKRIR